MPPAEARTSASSSSSAAFDYKPTSQVEPDRISESARIEFERAAALIDNLSDQEERQLQAFARLTMKDLAEYSLDEMARFLLENHDPELRASFGPMRLYQSYLGPRWLSAYEQMFVKARAIFAPEA